MGHLFVAHGSLTRLACDALVIPCDEELNVSEWWRPVLPDDTPPGSIPGWLRVEGIPNSHGVIDLPSAGDRPVFAFVSPLSGYLEPNEPVDILWEAVDDIVGRLYPDRRREMALIGIPLVGTGEGGLAHRRGEVIAELLDRHRSEPLSVDLALMLLDRRDFAAVQNLRLDEIDWPELTLALRYTADELGHLAAKKELSLFLGAGVSQPAGLPAWPQLLELLAAEAGMPLPSFEDGFEKAASQIKADLGDDYYRVMVRHLDADNHAVGHALLAGLRVNQMVTTNFDPCMELALESIESGRFRVLVRELAEGGKPWLLKLHGDIRLPETIILDCEDVERHKVEGMALRGVVQSLLLTSHLLFVGFSFKDQDFLDLAEAVSVIRAAAKSGSVKPVGTAIALTQSDADSVGYRDLETVVMRSVGPDEGARMLEIFLDRLAWTAIKNHSLSAEYLLDERYESGLSDNDQRLRDLLERLEDDADSDARRSSGWSRVAACLRDLGRDPIQDGEGRDPLRWG